MSNLPCGWPSGGGLLGGTAHALAHPLCAEASRIDVSPGMLELLRRYAAVRSEDPEPMCLQRRKAALLKCGLLEKCDERATGLHYHRYRRSARITDLGRALVHLYGDRLVFGGWP